MTVIAWDGKTLAADKRASSVGYGYTVTKLRRLKDGSIAAITGNGDEAGAVLAWLNSERDPEKYPPAQKDNDTSVLVVRRDLQTLGYELLSFGKTPHPQKIEDPIYAMGHGRDFALAGMHCGLSARAAVELTCKLDFYCGNGVDVLELRD
jgi:hypothetical protein